MTTETQTKDTNTPTPITDIPTDKREIKLSESEKKLVKKSIATRLIPVVLLVLILGWAAYVYKADQPPKVSTTVEQKDMTVIPDMSRPVDLSKTSPDLKEVAPKATEVKAPEPLQSLPTKVEPTKSVVPSQKPLKKGVKKPVQAPVAPVTVEQKVEVKAVPEQKQDTKVEEVPAQSDVSNKDAGK